MSILPSENEAPVISDINYSTSPIHDGDPITDLANIAIESGAIDPDGDEISCEWSGTFGNYSGCDLDIELPSSQSDYEGSLCVTDCYGLETCSLVSILVGGTKQCSYCLCF